MTDDQSQDPQREVERLAAELARKERENDELKQELARTKEVQDDLWSHDIYLKARKKMLGGVIAVLGVLSALGLVTVYEFYKRSLEIAQVEMIETISPLIQAEASALVQAETERIIEEADEKMDERIAGLVAEKKKEMDSQFEQAGKQVNQRIAELVTEKKKEINSLFDTTEKLLNARIDEDIGTLINKKKLEIDSLIASTKTKVDKEIAQLKGVLIEESAALTKKARQIQKGITASAKAEPVKTKILQSIVVCDPNYLDEGQVARVAVQQLSEGTGKFVRQLEVFKNTVFLVVRGTDETANAAAEASCILDGVDRVVYGADPEWYSPSEFVRIDRENEFRFTISGWGPTVLTAQVYFIGRRDPESFAGNLKISEVAGANKKYLGDRPQEFR